MKKKDIKVQIRKCSTLSTNCYQIALQKLAQLNDLISFSYDGARRPESCMYVCMYVCVCVCVEGRLVCTCMYVTGRRWGSPNACLHLLLFTVSLRGKWQRLVLSPPSLPRLLLSSYLFVFSDNTLIKTPSILYPQPPARCLPPTHSCFFSTDEGTLHQPPFLVLLVLLR